MSLGVDPKARIPDFRSSQNHVVGNGMRLDSTEKICFDDRWRSVLTEQDIEVFDSIAGEMGGRYRYV